MLLSAPRWLATVDSTNTRLTSLVKEHSVLPGTILAARAQTAGRGRYDRRWLARPDCNLTFSVYVLTAQGFPAIASVPMAAGLAVAEYLRQEHKIGAQVKWPNDVMVGGKKICGILSERLETAAASSPSQPQNHIIVGIGVNLNMNAADAGAVDKPATSVLLESGQTSAPERELLQLSTYLEKWLTRWDAGGFAALRADWLQQAWRRGEPVAVGDGEHRQEGILHDFGPHGELILRLPDQTLKTCWSGDFEY